MYRHKIVDFSSHLALPQIALETPAVDFHGSIFARDGSAERKEDPAHHWFPTENYKALTRDRTDHISTNLGLLLPDRTTIKNEGCKPEMKERGVMNEPFVL